MCLGVPGKIVSIEKDLAEIDFGGIKREASLLLCPEATEGDYVLVHVGFAIERLNEGEALGRLRLLKEIEETCLGSAEDGT